MRNFWKMIATAVLAAAIIASIAELGLFVLNSIAPPFELDPDDGDILLAAIIVTLPAGLLAALWAFRGSTELQSWGAAAAEIVAPPQGLAVAAVQPMPFLQAISAAIPPMSSAANDPAPPAPAVGSDPPAPADAPAIDSSRCRSCGAPSAQVFIDFGLQPSTIGLLRPEDGENAAPAWPLRIAKCDACHLVQVSGHRPAETCARFAVSLDHGSRSRQPDVDAIISGLHLGGMSRVVEIGSGSGRFLHRFIARGIPAVGIEADHAAGQAALDNGVPTRVCPFDTFSARKLVKDGFAADLLVARDVLTRTANPAELVDALRMVLKRNGVLLVEFPCLLTIVQKTQFDAISHERLSYFSLLAAEQLFETHQLRILHATSTADQGWLRVYACRIESTLLASPGLAQQIEKEIAAGLDRFDTFEGFAERSQSVMRQMRAFLAGLKQQGKTVAAYGTSAKGAAVLNQCRLDNEIVAYAIDPDPRKHGLILPGTKIPVAPPDRIREDRPDFILVLPGSSVQEVARQHRYVGAWGGQFGCLDFT